jgi:4a-hydroxytetrahydrobiopterin dehydratase
MPLKLTDSEISRSLSSLPGWTCKDHSLVKRFSFKTYMDGIRFVEMVAVDAEARDHHPDLLVKYGEVTAFLTTHSAEGITFLDLESAKAIDSIAAVLTNG